MSARFISQCRKFWSLTAQFPLPQTALIRHPIIWLLVLGLAVRIIVMIVYLPSVMLCFDSIRYARVEPRALFADFWMPAGYPMFLKLLRRITRQLCFTIGIQHLMGLGSGVMLFGSMRKLGASSWMASIPAAVVFLSGDHLYLEHQIMADSFLIFLTCAGLAAAVYALANRLKPVWLSVASVNLALAATARSVGLVLLPILAVCTFMQISGSSRKRAGALAAATLPGGAMFGLYWLGYSIAGGAYLGFCDMGGWNLYSRVAPFADCGKFTPPAGTAILCEKIPPAKRPGPFGYVWDLNSVPRRNFALNPQGGEKLGAFARQVIIHQPTDYARAVLFDLARYVNPSIGSQRAYGGQPREILSFGWRDKALEEFIVGHMSKKYRGTKVHLRWQEFLASYQRIFRVNGFMLAAFIALTLIGMITARGALKFGVFLFGLTAFAFYIVPVLTVSYDFRYGIPAETFIVVSGLLGAIAWQRRGSNAQPLRTAPSPVFPLGR